MGISGGRLYRRVYLFFQDLATDTTLYSGVPIHKFTGHKGHRPAAALTARDLDAFVARRLRSVKRTTVHADLTALQSVINWAVARGYLGRNPLAGYRKPKRDDAIIDPPRREEIERILAAAAPHLVRAIMISYFTGWIFVLFIFFIFFKKKSCHSINIFLY